MSMTKRPYVSSLWHAMPSDLSEKLDTALEEGISQSVANGNGQPRMFFRADDIGIPSRLHSAMVSAFARAQAPLGLAIVPAWFSVARWKTMRAELDACPELWCLSQHGWRHKNHQTEGKKGEFGSYRHKKAKSDDIAKGRAKLESILQNRFVPIFTPPWNRMDMEALKALEEQRFIAVSRTMGAVPISPIPDVAINVDLHTRREATPVEGWNAFLAELTAGLATGTAGVMLHHQRMNANSVAFLTMFLPLAARKTGVTLVHMQDCVL